MALIPKHGRCIVLIPKYGLLTGGADSGPNVTEGQAAWIAHTAGLMRDPLTICH